jgi:YbgC/YbaW family acyl-CoA thioester hydrolase
MGRTGTFRLRVRWGEADAMGIVFYPNFFTWFDQATHELIRGPEQDLLSLLRDGGLSVPIVQTGARFLAPAFYDDDLVVTSTIALVRSRSFRVEHTVERGDVRIATGFEARVAARRSPDTDRLEVVPLPEDLRSWLASNDSRA